MGSDYKIGDRAIGPEHPPYIIAEAGINHGGDVGDMITVAAEAGCDAFKIQCYTTDRLLAEEGPLQERRKEAEKYLRAAELLPGTVMVVGEWCKADNLHFIASPFDVEWAKRLPELGVDALKVASPCIKNLSLLQQVGASGLPIIVSFGMWDREMSGIGPAPYRAIQTPKWFPNIWDHQKAKQSRVVASLYCISKYPTELSEARLCEVGRKYNWDAYETGVPGFSDHTVEVETGAIAVAAGACVLEKHFTLDKKADGPDHHFSLEPDELKEYVRLAHMAWRAMGRGEDKDAD